LVCREDEKLISERAKALLGRLQSLAVGGKKSGGELRLATADTLIK
jgi:hypothetical protein